MDSNKKPLPSPPPPPKNGNTRGRPPLVSAKVHDEKDGGAVGVGDMEAAALRRGSPCTSRDELSGSGRHELSGSGHHELAGSSRRLEGKASVGCHGRDDATAERRGLPARYSRVVARLGLASLGNVAAVDGLAYACADCSMTFGRDTALSGHMRSHKRDHLSSESEEDASTPKRRRKKRKSKLRTVKPLEATWGNHARRNGTPRNAPTEVKESGSESNVSIRNMAAAMHDSNEVTENDHSGDDISLIIIDDDDDDTNPVIAVAGSHGAPGPAPDVAATLALASASAVAVSTPTPTPHAAAPSVNIEGAPAAASTSAVTIPPPLASVAAVIMEKDKEKLDLQIGPHMCKVCNLLCQTEQELSFHMMCVHPHPAVAATASANKEKSFKATGINNIGAAVDGPYNTMGWQVPAGAPRSAILTLRASMAPVHQPPQGTMAMVSNPVTGHFSAANTSTGWSLPGTTRSILPAIHLHNQEQNPPEQIAAVAPSNHGHHIINPALFSFSRRQEIAVAPSNAIASSSSTPRPGIAAATKPSQAVGINNYFAAIDAPANTMGRRLPFFLAGRSDTQALPLSRPVRQPTQGTTMDGNPLTSHFPAAISATGWSFHAITNSTLPSIPLPFFLTGRSVIHAPPVSMPVHQPTQGMAAMAGNPVTGVTGHFPAAMAGNGCSFPATTSSVLPAIPLQTQEENPPQGRVVPANELAEPSQNQAENPPEETVPGNNGGRTILLFGTNIAEGQKEVKEQK